MSKNWLRTGFFAVALMLTANLPVQAKGDLGFPTIGVRGQAMGNAFVAVANDINAIGWNPAGLAMIKDRQAQVSHTDLYDLGVDYNYVAFAQHGFGVGWAHIDSGDFLMGGGDYTQDMYMVSGAEQMDPQTYVGATLKWHSQKFAPPGTVYTNRVPNESINSESLSGDGYSIDAGVLYLVDEATTVGAAIYDLFGEIKTKNNTSGSGSSDSLNPNIVVGFSRRPREDSLYSLQISHLGEESTVHLGMERKIQDELVLRAGVDDEVVTAGFGFIRNEWELNYSYKNKTALGLEQTQRFGAIVHF